MTTPDHAELVAALDGVQALHDLMAEEIPTIELRARRRIHGAGRALRGARENLRLAAEMEARGETEEFDLRTWRKDDT